MFKLNMYSPYLYIVYTMYVFAIYATLSVKCCSW